MMQLTIFIFSYYLFTLSHGFPKTSAETGNDIENFLMERNSVKQLSPKSKEKKPDKFMEDLIEVQRTYRNLKEKWQRMMEEKNKVIRMASNSSTTTTTTTTPSSVSSEIQEIDMDVFEAPDKFQDISDLKTEFDDEAFVDISVTSPESSTTTTTMATSTVTRSQLEEIQAAIHDAFDDSSPPTLFEIIGPTTKKRSLPEETTMPSMQMDGAVTRIGVDQTKPTAAITSSTEPLNLANVVSIVPNNNTSSMERKSLLSTFGSQEPIARPFPRKVATPWRKKLENESQEVNDPFETTTRATSTPIFTEPSTTTSTTTLPPHILPASSFHSSGANPNSVSSINLFRYPEQVNIPFFGSKSTETNTETVSATPLPSDAEIGDSKKEKEKEIEEEEEVEVSSDEEESEYEGDRVEEAEDVEEITALEKEPEPSTPRGIENNEDYVEETFSKEIGDSEVPSSFGIGKAPAFEEQTVEADDSLSGSERSSEFADSVGSLTEESALSEIMERPLDSSMSHERKTSDPDSTANSEVLGPPPSPSTASPRNDDSSTPELTRKIDSPGVFGNPPASSSKSPSDALRPIPPQNFGSPPSSSGVFGSPPSSIIAQLDAELSQNVPKPARSSGVPISNSPFGIGRAPPAFAELDSLQPELPRQALQAFPPGIGRSPPGFSGPSPPTETTTKFPVLLSQNQEVENFFNDGASSSLGSFSSEEHMPVHQVGNVNVHQQLEILSDPVTTTTTTTGPSSSTTTTTSPKTTVSLSQEQVGIFETKLAKINQKAYRPPMFPSTLSSEVVEMPRIKNSYYQRTTVPPIGPHGLRQPEDVMNTVDTELPAWGMGEKDRGIMNKARRQYQKEFEQQIRDVRLIDEEINRISKMNDDGRSKNSQRCSKVYAHTLSLPQIERMSYSLGLGDVASVIRMASDLTPNHENDIAQLEVDLEEKRKLIAKVEILLSLSESRALLFDLLNEQKKMAESMENHALDLLQKNNFRPQTPSPFSAASDISELSSAVRQVLNSRNPGKKGWSMMKRKLQKKNAKKTFELINPNDVAIRNNFIYVNKKSGHLQETAEVVEPVLPLPVVTNSHKNDQFGRKPVSIPAVHIRPLPVAPPTMSPKFLILSSRPSQRAANRIASSKPLAPPTDDEITESETVHELIDMLHEDIVKLPAEKEDEICRQVQCNFEKADLCNFESSHDETTRLRLLKSRRQKRAALTQTTVDLLAEPTNIADDLLPYTFRAWSIWAGRRAEKQKQIDIGPSFSPHNLHFAAVFLEPQQAGILSIPLVLSPTSTRIRLRLFEASRGIRLRVCCDRYCPLETEHGLYKGHKKWLRKTVTCPANTQTLSFECLNDGSDRGACGIDEVFVDSPRCPQLFDGSDQH